MNPMVKEEILEEGELLERDLDWGTPPLLNAIPLSACDCDFLMEEGGHAVSVKETRASDLGVEEGGPLKRPKIEGGGAGFVLPPGFLDPLPPKAAPLKRPKIEGGNRVVLPPGFLDPLPPKQQLLMPQKAEVPPPAPEPARSCRQFWKAGDYEGHPPAKSASFSDDMDHLRVHPKFLHSNATSHKWVLGALAELLDNSVDEVCHGATLVSIDMLENQKDRTKMLLVEDDGGGMNPDRLRQCMSLGYSMKGKSKNTIGQYGNGFKTSTMRVGADVIVFSRCRGEDGTRPTQSIGMLSYTFLTKEGKEDIVVPMIDYVKEGEGWNMMTRASPVVWNKNMETIVQWSPYLSEADLLQQFSSMTDHGTRIVIYNLWEDDQGELELDFDADVHDIQVRGVNRDEKKIEMAKQFPNSRHFLTYQHSLRSYASILYLRLPDHFRMVLRGIEIEHHNIVNDMMFKKELTYRPQIFTRGVLTNKDLVAVVTVGFVKDAKDHVDVQGFNVYHKNRLIKPFWRIWNAAGSSGRGVLGVLEANFVEPAHDKQGFELTTVLSRLEARLLQIQKTYWTKNCHKIGYSSRHGEKESSHDASPAPSSQHFGKDPSASRTADVVNRSENTIMNQSSQNPFIHLNHIPGRTNFTVGSATLGGVNSANGHFSCAREFVAKGAETYEGDLNSRNGRLAEENKMLNGRIKQMEELHKALIEKLTETERKLEEANKLTPTEFQYERDRNAALTEKLKAAERKFEDSDKEQDALIEVFLEERSRREKLEEDLRKKLMDACATIQELMHKLSSNQG